MKSIRRSVVFLAIAVFVGSAVAGDKVVVVPIVDDTPSTHSTLFIKSNGQKIGVLDSTGDFFDGSWSDFSGYSFNEYFFGVKRQSGRLWDRTIYFATSDCTGQAYLGAGGDSSELGTFTESQGAVFSSAPGYAVPAYYVPRGTSSVVMSARSQWDYLEVCNTINSEIAVYPVLPNDPAVTGVKNSYQLPINAGF